MRHISICLISSYNTNLPDFYCQYYEVSALLPKVNSSSSNHVEDMINQNQKTHPNVFH